APEERAGAQRPAKAAQARGAEPAAAPRRTAASRAQRLYIKITADREQPALLAQLKQLLASHAGPLDTVLFYEREQKTMVLSEKSRVKPSPSLIAEIDKLLGKGSAVVK
ncbi:hypothetical protein DNH61_19040, partial [Paenibacillus sambharensis]